MTRIAYLDCPSGISGDMTLAALIHAGASLDAVRKAVDAVLGHPLEMSVEPASSSGIHGLHLRVGRTREQQHQELHDHSHEHEHGQHHGHDHEHDHEHDHHHEHAHAHAQDRAARDILEAIARAGLEPAVADRASLIFRRLAIAEGRVHGVSPDDVHFHEVGAEDSIADIVGIAAALADLGIDQVQASPLPMTRGFVNTRHGRMPIPAPATIEVLRDWDVVGQDIEGEFVTPTGAAVCAALAGRATALPQMRVRGVGYGFGTRNWPDGRPNCVRVILGERDMAAGTGEWEVSANLDDLSPDAVSVLVEALFKSGALDAWVTPIVMKKGRPAWTVSAIATAEKRDAVITTFFLESTTIGIRMHPLHRQKLDWELVDEATTLGTLKVKVARLNGRVVNVSLESDDVRRLAADAGITVKQARDTLWAEVAGRHPVGQGDVTAGS